MRDIVGDQMLRLAVNKMQSQVITESLESSHSALIALLIDCMAGSSYTSVSQICRWVPISSPHSPKPQHGNNS